MRLGLKALVVASSLLVWNASHAFDLRLGPGGAKGSNIENAAKVFDLDSPTLRVETAAAGGSAVLIGRRSGFYTALTAKHVVSASAASEIEISVNGTYVDVEEVLLPFPDLDLAIVRFRSDLNLPLAYIPSMDSGFWQEIGDWSGVVVEGFSNSSSSVRSVVKRSSPGSILAFVDDNAEGYNLLHSAVTTTGISGGPIFGQPNSSLFYVLSDVLSESTKFEKTTVKDHLFRYQHSSGGTQLPNGHFESDDQWNRSMHQPIENKFMDACVSDSIQSGSSDLLHQIFSAYLRSSGAVNPSHRFISCKMITYQLLNMLGYCQIPAYSTATQGSPYASLPLREPFRHFLLAIHGRAEAYTYGGKSGAGLGIFLGSEEITDWFKANKKKLGLVDRSGVYMACRHAILRPEESYY